MSALYAIALGSNQRTRFGSPEATLRTLLALLPEHGLEVVRTSCIVATRAVGPAGRRFANAATLVTTALAPPDLLVCLKALERRFGRRGGRRWGARPLDLDILLWSGGRWPPQGDPGNGLAIPHRAMTRRRFVLDPLAEIAPGWRLPHDGRSIRAIAARLRR